MLLVPGLLESRLAGSAAKGDGEAKPPGALVVSGIDQLVED